MSDEATVEQFIESAVRIQLRIKELEAQLAEGKELVRTYFDEPGTHKVGKFFVKVTTNSRLDDGLARKVLDADVYDLVSKQTLDTAKARAHLTPTTLAEVTKTYDNRIELGIL